ncbi:MAG: DnaA N-terminal domain-containing protein [Alphaproteobacteria bacterium]|nr:DnaA N-terminal domain-containing protein [Alphaproteobacteria bacterium]
MIKSKVLLQEDKCLVMQPELIKIAGKSAALLLQQIHYWISNENVQGKIHNKMKWIANSYEAWTSDIKIISRSTIGRSINTLKNLGILFVEKLSDFKNNRTNWYTINYNRITEILSIHNIDHTIQTSSHLNAIPDQNVVDEQFKMSSCSIQNEPMYIDKKTNKDVLINLNKSINCSFSVIKKEKIEKPLTKQMIDIWNEIIQPEINCVLTKSRCRFLVAALKYKFNNDIKQWKNYCYKLTSSDYLMGKIKNGFKISLDSILKFDFIQKIFEKQFGVKDLQTSFETEKTIYQKIEDAELSGEIKEIHHKICEKIGTTKYISWFKETKISKLLNSIYIFVDNNFKKQWIGINYQRDLEALFNMKIKIVVN